MPNQSQKKYGTARELKAAAHLGGARVAAGRVIGTPVLRICTLLAQALPADPPSVDISENDALSSVTSGATPVGEACSSAGGHIDNGRFEDDSTSRVEADGAVWLAALDQLYCHYCRDPVDQNSYRICGTCSAVMCLQVSEGSAGCIVEGTVKHGPFTCPDCTRAGHLVMDYRVDGYGIRREAKIAWPIYLSTLTLKGLASTISQLLKITMTDEYRCDSSKLLLRSGELKPNGDALMRKKCESASIAFIDSAGPNFPPNFIVVIDTHSEGFSGRLVTSQSCGSQSLDKILEAYLGTKFLDKMALASRAARKPGQTSTPPMQAGGKTSRSPWTPYSAQFRGGWRVAILVTCGPTARNEGHWGRICDALKADRLDIVVTFGGAETIPSRVQYFVCALVEEISTHGAEKPWDAVIKMAGRHEGVLEQNTVVGVWVDPKNRDRVIGKALALHCVERPFGVKWPGCGLPSCQAARNGHSLKGQEREKKIRQVCTSEGCQWKSGWIRLDEVEREDLFRRPRKNQNPRLYEHDFPQTDKVRLLFRNRPQTL